MRNSTASRIDLADFSFRADEFVVGAGEAIGFQVESDIDPHKIDHVWVTIRAGRFGPLRVSINTYSLKHAADGFDPRMRVGVIASQWSQLPESGIFPAAGLDYAELERAQAIRVPGNGTDSFGNDAQVKGGSSDFRGSLGRALSTRPARDSPGAQPARELQCAH